MIINYSLSTVPFLASVESYINIMTASRIDTEVTTCDI